MKTPAPTRHSNFPLLAFCILHSAFCIALADPVPVRFNADAAAPQTFQAAAYRGETLDIEAQLTLRGAPLAVADAGAAMMHWQTNGMGAAWWTAPASVTTSGLVRARWTPSMDCGADAYRVFLGVADGGSNLSYRANMLLRMVGSPGETPNALPLPVPVLDFAKVAVTNEPWSTTSGLSTNNVLDLIAAATNAIPAGITEEQVREIVQNDSPVTSVNGDTGDIIIDAAAIGAVEDTEPRVHNYLVIDGNDGNPYLALYDDDEQPPAVTLFKSSILWRDSSTLFELYFPAQSGTLALLEDIPSIDGLATVEDVASVTQRVDVASSAVVRYATGVLNLTIPQSATLSANTSGWPDGAAVFVRVSANGAYSVAQGLSLVGYGFWPTNSATVVFVRDGQTVRANVVQGN